MFEKFQKTYTFDDILMVPQESDILPKDTILKTRLTKEIELHIPFLSAPMDTVTESNMAIAMALRGGLGFIHKNLSIDEQIREVKKVKRYENGFIKNPMTVPPTVKIEKVVQIRKEHGFKKIPITDKNGILVGLISDVDYLMPYDEGKYVSELMTSVDSLIVGESGISLDHANSMIRHFKLKVLPIVDKVGRLESIVARRDIEKNNKYPDSVKSISRQLLVGAAIGIGDNGIQRADSLVEAGVDVICIDTAHGHSANVMNTVKILRKKYDDLQIIAGNIVTSEAANMLIDAGVSAIKVGVGPGSICTTRVVAATGVPQVSAIMEVRKAVNNTRSNISIIADGGIKTSGDIIKALGVGADAIMMGNIFAGTDESPGKVEYRGGKVFKRYRGMGSVEAMDMGSKDRYGQAEENEKKKYIPEGVSGYVPYKGHVEGIVHQLAGGLRSGMGYCGAKTLKDLQKKSIFVRISGAGLKESHPHDLSGFESAPNYNSNTE